MKPFVREDSVVRWIWGKPDTILFVFAGAAAEFALNRAVDWLFFTGRLPADPLGRLFSTVTYARDIVFSSEQKAFGVIDNIARIHHGVEEKRGYAIPDWAYRDVLYMLIDYSIRSAELLGRNLSSGDREEVYDVFHRVGARMGIPALPATYAAWVADRALHMEKDLACSDLSLELYRRYRQHLGPVRYAVLRAGQAAIVPPLVKELLRLRYAAPFRAVLLGYRGLKALGLDKVAKHLVLPDEYRARIDALEIV